jgi:hypothetical protein
MIFNHERHEKHERVKPIEFDGFRMANARMNSKILIMAKVPQ